MFLTVAIFWFLAPYCSLNPTLRNGGIINKTGGPAGSKVRYYCKPGYRMIGHNNATCRRYQNGMYQWDSPLPICHGKIMLSSQVGFCNFIVRLFHKTKMQHFKTVVCQETLTSWPDPNTFWLVYFMCAELKYYELFMQSNTDQMIKMFSVFFSLVMYILANRPKVMIFYNRTFYKIQ